jgi:hypothetical protein
MSLVCLPPSGRGPCHNPLPAAVRHQEPAGVSRAGRIHRRLADGAVLRTAPGPVPPHAGSGHPGGTAGHTRSHVDRSPALRTLPDINLQLPEIRRPGDDEESGRGLYLVQHVASACGGAWGTRDDGTTWCALAR